MAASEEKDMKFEIDLDNEIVEHMLGEGCEANYFQPCGFSEKVMSDLWLTIRRDAVHTFKPMFFGDDYCSICSGYLTSPFHRREKATT